MCNTMLSLLQYLFTPVHRTSTDLSFARAWDWQTRTTVLSVLRTATRLQRLQFNLLMLAGVLSSVQGESISQLQLFTNTL